MVSSAHLSLFIIFFSSNTLPSSIAQALQYVAQWRNLIGNVGITMVENDMLEVGAKTPEQQLEYIQQALKHKAFLSRKTRPILGMTTVSCYHIRVV